MALSEEQIKQQIDVLTAKTSENPEMVYKVTAALNKGLNPAYFSGNNSKIVNAINKLAAELNMLNKAVRDMIDNTNDILLDVKGEETKDIWEVTKQLMGEDTIIEGIKAILEGRKVEEILNLHPADEGKLLSVEKNDKTGALEVKPISIDSLTVEVGAYDVAYINRDFGKINSVGEAIDHILEDMQQPLQWDELVNRPKLADELVIEEDALVLKSIEDEELSNIPITSDEDIENIIDSLDL